VLPLLVAAWLAELAGLAAAAVSDVRRRIVPNAVVLLLAVNGILLRLIQQSNWRSVICSLAAAGCVLVVLGQLARRGMTGGGDAKLIAAVTLAVPLPQVVSVLLAIMLAGGLLSCLYMAARCRARPGDTSIEGVCRGGLRWMTRVECRRTACEVPMPYALAVFLGSVGFGVSEMIR